MGRDGDPVVGLGEIVAAELLFMGGFTSERGYEALCWLYGLEG